MNSRTQNLTGVAIAGLAALVTTLYLLTLQRTIVGICAQDYCADIGEFQVALPLWGTVHHTGYPLYMLVGSPFVTLLAALGVTPATGASLYSLVWQVLAVVGLALLLHRLSGRLWLSVSSALVFALIEPIWVHGVIAEVYSLGMLFAVAILYLTVDLKARWSDKRAWLLAFVCGLGLAHHRLLIFLVVAIGIYLLPVFWRSTARVRWLALAVPLALAGFLPYLDIPLRMALGSTWTYSPENTWAAFWHIFFAQEEANRQLQPSLAPSQILATAQAAYQVLINDLTLPGLLLTGIAAAYLPFVRHTRWLAACLLATLLAYLAFALLLPRLHLTQQSFMYVYLILMVTLALSARTLQPRWHTLLAVLCIGWALWLGVRNWSFVMDLTQDASGLRYAADVERLDAPDGAIVMAPWGSAYFILSYAHRVEGRMPNRIIVDHRADFRTMTDNGAQPIYTHAANLYLFGLDWWHARVDAPLRVASAGPNVAMLTSQPFPRAETDSLPIGNHLALSDWRVNRLGPQELHVVLHWTATAPPSASYSTFVHVSDQPAIQQAEHILGQSDYAMPVYGRYPTTEWIPDELVREDHTIRLREERSPQTLVVGMYGQSADGAIQPLGSVHLQHRDGAWIARPESR